MALPPPRRLDAAGLFEYAVRVLGGRAHAAGELRAKLSRKAAAAADVDPVLARLKDLGYLDDKRFAESFAAARKDNQGLGKTRVIRDLRARRVSGAVADRAVRSVYAGANEEAMIDAYVRRKYRNAPSGTVFQAPKDLAAAYRRLIHAGFESGPVIRALKKFAADPELLDRFEPEPEESADG
jgi:regulatory protein